MWNIEGHVGDEELVIQLGKILTINSAYYWQQNCMALCAFLGLFQDKFEMEVTGPEAILSYLPK